MAPAVQQQSAEPGLSLSAVEWASDHNILTALWIFMHALYPMRALHGEERIIGRGVPRSASCAAHRWARSVDGEAASVLRTISARAG